jgi:hypothetical protein
VTKAQTTTNSLASKIIVGFSSLEFLSLGRKKEEQPDEYMVRPLHLHVGIGSLYVNSIQAGLYPLMEPFTYVATVRRVYGMRFVNMDRGYEIIGRPSKSTQEADRNGDSDGLVLHFSPERLQTLQNLKDMLSPGPRPKQEEDIDFHIFVRKTESKKLSTESTKASYLLYSALGLLVVFGLVFFNLFSNQIAGLGHIIIFVTIVSVLGIFATRLLSKQLPADCNLESMSNTRVSSSNATGGSAVFRLPISFISVITPGSTRLTFSKVSVLGRVDGSMVNMTASGIDLICTSSQIGPRISLSGIRALIKPEFSLLNVDVIDELFIPGLVRLAKPVLMTVVRFEEDALKVNLNSIEADILNDTGGPSPASHEKKTHTVNVKEARQLINADILREQKMLKFIAMMFEAIPVQNNRHKMRLYPKSFRGKDAVDFLLESKLADSRHEAIKIARDLQVEFNLFQHVAREFNFRDDSNCLFRFVDVTKRRSWGDDSLYLTTTNGVYDSTESPPLPFPIIINFQEVVVKNGDSGAHLISLRNAELDAKAGKNVGVIDFTVFVGEVENKMIYLCNARMRALVYPDLPTEIHKLQFSVESLYASPGYSPEDWYAMSGFTGKDNTSQQPEKDNTSQQAGVTISLPFAYIAPFNLHLSYKGVLIDAAESVILVDPFIGSEETTSNDLIQHFVMVILGRAPGILANVRVLGVNVVESTGVATAMSVGARFIPFGQYAGIGALALYDGVTGAVDAGKVARDDPNDKWKAGDFVRGVFHSADVAARAGAERRGKTHDEFYDDNDKVVVDPLDLALGTAGGAFNYMYGNKARFAGATVGGVTMVAATVAAGPIGGIVVGVVAGSAAEYVVNRVEDQIEPDDVSPNSSL